MISCVGWITARDLVANRELAASDFPRLAAPSGRQMVAQGVSPGFASGPAHTSPGMGGRNAAAHLTMLVPARPRSRPGDDARVPHAPRSFAPAGAEGILSMPSTPGSRPGLLSFVPVGVAGRADRFGPKSLTITWQVMKTGRACGEGVRGGILIVRIRKHKSLPLGVSFRLPHRSPSAWWPDCHSASEEL